MSCDDVVITSAITHCITRECAHREQAHTHERVAERVARRRKDESSDRSAVSSALLSLLMIIHREMNLPRLSARRDQTNKIYLMFIFVLFVCFTLVPPSCVSPDARG
jgi:hypothetical protein